MTPAELAGLLLLATTDRLLMGFKWGRLLRIVGVRTPMSQLIRIFYQANLSGVFLPSHVGGDAACATFPGSAAPWRSTLV